MMTDDINGQLDDLRSQLVKWMEGRFKGIDNRMKTFEDGLDGLRSNQEHLILVIDGDEKSDVPGLIERTRELETQMEKLLDRWHELSWMGKGFLLGLGINIAAVVATLLAVAKVLAEIQATHPIP